MTDATTKTPRLPGVRSVRRIGDVVFLEQKGLSLVLTKSLNSRSTS